MKKKFVKKTLKTTDLEQNLVMMNDKNPKVLDKLEETLTKRREAYDSKKHYKYYVLTVGFLIGNILGYIVPQVISTLTNAAYQRTDVDNIL